MNLNINLNIRTKRDDFEMIDRISAVDSRHIEGIKTLEGCPVAMVIESLAQLGALHVRFITAFKKHCFLLLIPHLEILDTSALHGSYRLYGSLTAESKRAFSYTLRATRRNRDCLKGRLVFGTLDYDARFRRERLAKHYQRMFACLTKDLTKSSP